MVMVIPAMTLFPDEMLTVRIPFMEVVVAKAPTELVDPVM